LLGLLLLPTVGFIVVESSPPELSLTFLALVVFIVFIVVAFVVFVVFVVVVHDLGGVVIDEVVGHGAAREDELA
jgi:hypothetical protein